MGWQKLERRDVDFLYCFKLLLQAAVSVEYNLAKLERESKRLDCCLELTCRLVFVFSFISALQWT